jgi:uncharacterized protein YebE (UPF0316 family)
MDVTLGTIRFIFISRGLRNLAPLAGFFEVLIWIIVIGQIMQNLLNPLTYIAYAAGFATGTYIGIRIAEKISLGNVLIRIFTRSDSPELIYALRDNNHGVTTVDAQGTRGPVKLIFTFVQKRNVEKVIKLIKEHNPKAFYTINEVEMVQSGVFTSTPSRNFFPPFRKGK